MNNNAWGGAIRELQKIAAKEGVLALWKGVEPAMAREGALTASQLAAYDEFKRVGLATYNVSTKYILLFLKCKGQPRGQSMHVHIMENINY